MVIIQNHLGKIRYTKAFFYTLISSAVTSCFGVAGLVPSSKAEELFYSFPLVSKLVGNSNTKGMYIKISEGKVRIALHIAVVYVTNTTTLIDNIK